MAHVEAARNDPNARIYRNDAVINADRTFGNALKDAYRATVVFEYFTSQTYAGRERLFLTRLVSRGDYNLESYLDELDEAYYAFLETVGRPDRRVEVLSLRDDILAIPRLDEQGNPLSVTDRVARFRAALTDSGRLTPDGHTAFSFPTSFVRLSPLTANHKIESIEVEIVGSDVGDAMGRVYVAQSGTSAVRPIDGNDIYLRFPERTAVVNTFFNGVRSFGPDVYSNYRLRDRPYVNDGWTLLINQGDEYVNQDVNLESVTDVRLYIHYTDFTSF